MTKIVLTTPPGIARYPHITTPDLKGKFADGKFKTKLIVPKKDAAPLVEKLQTIAKEHKVSKLPFKDEDGNIVFTFKTQFKPLVVDARLNEVKQVDFRIGGGSRICVGFIVFQYDNGISLQMKQVQVLDLVDGNDVMFEAAEGSFNAADLSETSNGSVSSDSELDI